MKSLTFTQRSIGTDQLEKSATSVYRFSNKSRTYTVTIWLLCHVIQKQTDVRTVSEFRHCCFRSIVRAWWEKCTSDNEIRYRGYRVARVKKRRYRIRVDSCRYDLRHGSPQDVRTLVPRQVVAGRRDEMISRPHGRKLWKYQSMDFFD